MGKLAAVLIIPSLLGFPTVQPSSTKRQQDCLAPFHTSRFSGIVAGEKDHFCKGSLSLSIFCFTFLLFLLSYFCLLHFIQKNYLLFIVVICVACFIFVKWLLLKIPSCVTLLALTIMILSAHPLLHLLLKRPFMRLSPLY